jgi:hypothetical protein
MSNSELREQVEREVRFCLDDAQRAADEWGFNCGPAAICAVAGLTPAEIRPHMGDFERKGYTNPTLMWQVLRSLGIRWQCGLAQMSSENQGMLAWPEFGLARVQWEGPWTAPGVLIAARYRHTHWVASRREEGKEPFIFDVNAMCAGGWIGLTEWSTQLVPWLLRECEPKANGRWHLTHSVEIKRAMKGNHA